MRDLIEKSIIGAKIRARAYTEAFLSEERGDTNFVSIAIIIAIVLVVAGIFRTQLTQIVQNVMGRVTEFTAE